MNNIVKGFRTLTNKIEAGKRPETRNKYLLKFKRKLELRQDKERKANLLQQEKRRKQEERIQRKRIKQERKKMLRDVRKRQKELELERREQNAMFGKLDKKLRKEQRRAYFNGR